MNLFSHTLIHGTSTIFRNGNVTRHRSLYALMIPVLMGLGLAGCGEQQAGTTVAPPPPAVVAVRAEARPVEGNSQFVGRVVAVDKVELRARVQGFLKERKFTEGQQVEVGDVLFLIEPEQYQSVVQQRQADVAKAEADAENADIQLASGRELLKKKNIAKLKVDELKAAAAIAHASIAQSKAALTAAELDLGYTTIVAPVAGRIGLSRYSVGDLVGLASEPLATIVSQDPVYVQFPLTQRELLEARRDIKSKGGSADDVVVRVLLPDGSLYDQTGRLNFIDVTTDPGTDTVTLRAELPNPAGMLVDGQYVRVTVQLGEPLSAIVIPQSSLQVDQQGVFVMIIDAEQKAQIRRIQTGASLGAGTVVTSGLEEGDMVISEGVQKVRPGQVVSAVPAQSVENVEGGSGK